MQFVVLLVAFEVIRSLIAVESILNLMHGIEKLVSDYQHVIEVFVNLISLGLLMT